MITGRAIGCKFMIFRIMLKLELLVLSSCDFLFTEEGAGRGIKQKVPGTGTIRIACILRHQNENHEITTTTEETDRHKASIFASVCCSMPLSGDYNMNDERKVTKTSSTTTLQNHFWSVSTRLPHWWLLHGCWIILCSTTIIWLRKEQLFSTILKSRQPRWENQLRNRQ